MFKFLTIFIPLVIMLVCTFLKYDRSKNQIQDVKEKKKYKLLNSTEFQDTIIQVAIVFLGAFLAMSITEYMDKKAEYNKAESMMEALNFSHTNKFVQVYGEIKDLDVKSDAEKELDILAKSVAASSSLIERESLMNDYMISTLTPGTMMQISISYENIDRCVRKLEIVESKEEKTELIAEFCYFNCVLGFEYELLRKEPDFELLLLALDDSASKAWEKGVYGSMYSTCIDKLEESFNVDLTDWRERKPYTVETE